MMRTVFIAASTGYMGRGLISSLLERGRAVRALARAGSDGKVPPGCTVVRGNAFDVDTYAGSIPPADTFVHLVGTAHPAPWKEHEFRAVDLASLGESVKAARIANVSHFVFVSVAHPAPMMKAYIRVREECEQILADSGLSTTILRPWYVLGPGHRWPVILKPFYWLAEQIAATRAGAQRLGLVTLDEMAQALVAAVENPAANRIIEVPEIRTATAGSPSALSSAAGSTSASLPQTHRRG